MEDIQNVELIIEGLHGTGGELYWLSGQLISSMPSCSQWACSRNIAGVLNIDRRRIDFRKFLVLPSS